MKKINFVILILMLSMVCFADGAIWYTDGYNTFTDGDPQDDELFVENDATLDFLSGTAGGLRVLDTATANIYGGAITFDLWTTNNSVTNIHLIDLDLLVSDQDSIVNIYAYDVTFFSTGGSEGAGSMTGTFYQNDTSFSIDFYHLETVSHINVVPEPTTLLLFTISGLLLGRTRK